MVCFKDKENRKDKVLFIDARNMGYMETRRHRELKDEEVKKIYETYHAWKKMKIIQMKKDFHILQH